MEEIIITESDFIKFKEELQQQIKDVEVELRNEIRDIELKEPEKPINGKDGKDGRDGKNGISPDLQKIVSQVLLRIPRPKDGKDGESIQGEPGPQGQPGIAGKDITEVDPELLWETLQPFIEKRISEIPRPLGTRIMTPARSVKPFTSAITGTINGTNAIFTLADRPQSDAHLFLFVNGKKQKLTTDYSRSNATITFILAPLTGDDLEAQIFD